MRQEYRCNIGDHWQVTAWAEKEKMVEMEKWAKKGEMGRNGNQGDNKLELGWDFWSGITVSGMGRVE